MDKLTVKQVADEFGVYDSQVFAWIRDGKLNSEKEYSSRVVYKDDKYKALQEARAAK